MAAKSTPVATYTYADARGVPVLVVHRYHDADATKPAGYKKRFTQSTRGADGKWIAKNPRKNDDGSPRFNPLYGLPAITENPDAAVLVVEGEKTAKGAEQFIPDGWVITTWAGGSSAFKYTDWTPLKGRKVAIWPDNDTPGIKAAHEVAAILQGAPIIDLPDGLPDAWDLGDPLPDHLTVDAVRDLILLAHSQPIMLPARAVQSSHDAASQQPLNGHAVPMAKYRALGYKEGRFYFFSSRTHNVHDFNSKDLRSGNGLRDLEPDDLYWARQPRRASGGENGSPLDWKYLGDLAIAECYEFGVYNEENRRARGVWLDASVPHSASAPTPIVAHLGDEVLIDGVRTPIMAIEGRHIYPVDEPLLPAAPPDVPALTDDEGSDLRYLCRYLPWVNHTSGDLLAGLIATSVICGALKFRTHGWLTGPSGAGKSYIMENIVVRALDGIALHILGSSSEPGIRRHLSHDARPAIYDEAEGEGEQGRKRREMIIGLMRASSTETKAKILLGSGGKRGESFPVRAQFILGSVGTALDRATDQTRCLLLTLRGNLPTSESHRRDLNVKFSEIQEKIAALPNHLSVRLFKRMSGMVHTVRANAEMFRRLIAAKHASSRVGDQLGTVLAGTYALENGGRCSEAAAVKFLDAFPWNEYVSATDSTAADEGNLFNHLCAHYVRVETRNGIVTQSIGELAAIAAGHPQTDDAITPRMAQVNLGRVGIKYDAAMDTFRIATHHQQLTKVFANSQFPQGFIQIVGRVVGSVKSTSSDYFGGVGSRYVSVPAKCILGVAGQQTPIANPPMDAAQDSIV